MTYLAPHTFEPRDHLPASLRDADCRRRDDEIDRRKSLFRQARGMASALRTVTEKQRGRLTRADGHILSLMILQNLRSCVRRERLYTPTRARLARLSGYDIRTVSRALAKLKAAGVIVIARYPQGGRLGHRGRGLATEFRSGCLQFLADQLAALGYKLPRSLRDDLAGLARWAAYQVGESTEPVRDLSRSRKPTGTKCLATTCPSDRGSPQAPTGAQADHSQGQAADDPPSISDDPPGCSPCDSFEQARHPATSRPEPETEAPGCPLHGNEADGRGARDTAGRSAGGCPLHGNEADGRAGRSVTARSPLRPGSLAHRAMMRAATVPMAEFFGAREGRGWGLAYSASGGPHG